MNLLSLDELDGKSSAYDALVLKVQGVDAFCSSSHWGIPAAKGLCAKREPWVALTDRAGVSLMGSMHPGGMRVLEPLEAMWGLGVSLVGAARDSVALLDKLLRRNSGAWDAVVLTGLPVGSVLWNEIVNRFGHSYLIKKGPSVKRHVARLGANIDEYLGRRSRNHRKLLRRLSRRQQIHFEIEPKGTRAQLFERVLGVERRSWKGHEGVGIEGSSMAEFYRLMMARLLPVQHLHLIFAKDGDLDVGFVLGASWQGVYRGLQFAYDANYQSEGLGHRCQYEQIKQLYKTDVHTYDLGTAGLDYKTKWAEREFETHALIIYNR